MTTILSSLSLSLSLSLFLSHSNSHIVTFDEIVAKIRLPLRLIIGPLHCY